jgi:hypothetical protein
MPSFTDISGLAGVASAAVASLQLLPGFARRTTMLRTGISKLYLAILMGTLFVLMFAPFGGMPLAAYIRGMTGDLSITTLVLLWCALLRPWGACVTVKAKHRSALLILIALSASVFYPMALGIGTFDPYRLGYGSPQFVVVLLLLALFAWYRKSDLMTMCIAFATLAWSTGWYESGNLWDYLLDPFVSVYAVLASLFLGIKMCKKLRLDSRS